MEKAITKSKTKVRALKARAATTKTGGTIGGFMGFIREQGVVGLAVGLVLGTQVKTLVDQIVTSFINPLLGLILPGGGNLAQKTFSLTISGKTADFGYGAFLAVFISFVTVAGVVYFAVKGLKLDKLDKKKES